MAAPVVPSPPPNTSLPEREPTITPTVLAGLISGFLLIFVDRLTFLTDAEMSQVRLTIAAAAPVLAALLIRRKVVPLVTHEATVNFASAASYAQGVQDRAQAEADVAAKAAPRRRPPSTR